MLGQPYSPVGPLLSFLDARSPKGGGKSSGGKSSAASSSSSSSSSSSGTKGSSNSGSSESSSSSSSYYPAATNYVGSSTTGGSSGSKAVPAPAVYSGNGYWRPGYIGLLPVWAFLLIIIIGTMAFIFTIAIIVLCCANRRRASAGRKKRSGGRICGIALLAATGLLFWVWLFRACGCCGGKNKSKNKSVPENYEKLGGGDDSAPLHASSAGTTPAPAQAPWNAPAPNVPARRRSAACGGPQV